MWQQLVGKGTRKVQPSQSGPDPNQWREERPLDIKNDMINDYDQSPIFGKENQHLTNQLVLENTRRLQTFTYNAGMLQAIAILHFKIN